MALYESEAMLWIVGYILMALIYPIWYILLIVFADKDKQVDPVDIAKQESPYS
ncbi:hypothetical protein [Sulfurisphaera tokodaii]|uniref:Uncharacterized protein n=1 Tax=Sulfurisphaera tokodaii TaxID=111955 RepID=A0A832WR54_9CREN|nr:hypothetical protein [Sulfurisphaera tokodaii]HII73792.1 hypothetical protein [Sulfurisphaera tokodaii]